MGRYETDFPGSGLEEMVEDLMAQLTELEKNVSFSSANKIDHEIPAPNSVNVMWEDDEYFYVSED
jgi:hypothetical protein